ncbi:hypothetical protein KQX54_000213, partial [Cotesia glomerata]
RERGQTSVSRKERNKEIEAATTRERNTSHAEDKLTASNKRTCHQQGSEEIGRPTNHFRGHRETVNADYNSIEHLGTEAWFDGWRDNESHNSTPSSENSDIALDDLSFDALINERTLENGSTNGVLDDESEEELSGEPVTTMVETEEARLKRIISLTRHIPVFSGEGDVEPFIDAIEYCTPRLKDGDEETFIFELASRLSGVAVGSMRTVMKTARTIDAVIEHLRQNFGRTEDFFAILSRLTKLLQEENDSVARFGARLESMRSQAANKIDRSTLTADQKQYRNNDLNAAALETFIVGLTPHLSFAVSTQKPRNLTDALKVALEAEIQSEKTEAMNKLREDRVRRRERDHARIRLATYEEELQAEESTKKSNRESVGEEPLVFTVTNDAANIDQGGPKCYGCGEPGHFIRNCPDQNERRQQVRRGAHNLRGTGQLCKNNNHDNASNFDNREVVWRCSRGCQQRGSLCMYAYNTTDEEHIVYSAVPGGFGKFEEKLNEKLNLIHSVYEEGAGIAGRRGKNLEQASKYLRLYQQNT